MLCNPWNNRNIIRAALSIWWARRTSPCRGPNPSVDRRVRWMRRAPGWQGAPDGQQAKKLVVRTSVSCLPVNVALNIITPLYVWCLSITIITYEFYDPVGDLQMCRQHVNVYLADFWLVTILKNYPDSAVRSGQANSEWPRGRILIRTNNNVSTAKHKRRSGLLNGASWE